ncbi:MAG TPA: alpha/beta hydrolase [Myxococcota bacterium]|jgi:pimeloyl-ACP methyl ester carboxylesterase
MSAADGLEIARHGPVTQRAIVMLHEGLGSVSSWRDWPAQIAARTGLHTIAYSRRGYGRSEPCALPRPLDYMQREARGDLPALLTALRVEQAILLGHSDGASIAIVCAGDGDARVRGLVLIAPHVFVEALTTSSIEQAKRDYDAPHSELKRKLAGHHVNVDVAFHGWNDAWLDPGFALAFDITSSLPHIAVPVLAIQGSADPYGTLAQIDAIESAVPARAFHKLIVAGAGHAPQRSHTGDVTAAIVEAVAT